MKGIKLEDVHLCWAEFQENWAAVVDRIVCHFPQAERRELLKLNGERTAFVGYLAKVHDLTLAEAAEVVDFVLLGNPGTLLQTARAA